MELLLLRHGMTKGNREGRYIGSTEEVLCEKGRQALWERKQEKWYPPVDRLYVSPMKRCLETAALLYPGQPIQAVTDFQECDFGRFEGKTYRDLSLSAHDKEAYQAWVDSEGTLPFPEGESPADFKCRCVNAAKDVLAALEAEGFMETKKRAAFIIHGGTIMAIMEKLEGSGSFYRYQVSCGGGFLCQVLKKEEADVSLRIRSRL